MGGFHDQLHTDNLDAALGGNPFVTQIIFQPRLTSTNDLAKKQASDGAAEGLLVIADEQTVGRGRLGRCWWAPPGSALLTSLLFRPPARSDRPITTGDLQIVQQLVMLCALAAADAITDMTALPVAIKWPNDLTIRGRKVAGLLAESIVAGDRFDAAIVGLGLNVNTDLANAPAFIASATSLKLELDQAVDRVRLLAAYLDGVAHRYARMKAGMRPFEEWASRLATVGQYVTAYLDKQPAANDHSWQLSGIAQGVDSDGALLLRTADGVVHRLLAADVSLQERITQRSI